MTPPRDRDLADVPACDTGPAGRLSFVIAEIRSALHRRKDRKTDRTATRSDRWTS
jgi:hypothetical protein